MGCSSSLSPVSNNDKNTIAGNVDILCRMLILGVFQFVSVIHSFLEYFGSCSL
jgi:hypothetical protein